MKKLFTSKTLRFAFIPTIAAGLLLTGIKMISEMDFRKFDYAINLMTETGDNIPEDVNEINNKNDNTGKQFKEVTISDIVTINKLDSKYVLYLGWNACQDCKDFRENVLPKLGDKYVPIYSVDRANYETNGSVNNEWIDMFGYKNYDDSSRNKLAKTNRDNGEWGIKDLNFAYTPTLALVINGVAVDTFWQFGGSGYAKTEKEYLKDSAPYRQRYYRWVNSGSRHEEGYQNAIKDVNALMAKWKNF